MPNFGDLTKFAELNDHYEDVVLKMVRDLPSLQKQKTEEELKAYTTLLTEVKKSFQFQHLGSLVGNAEILKTFSTKGTKGGTLDGTISLEKDTPEAPIDETKIVFDSMPDLPKGKLASLRDSLDPVTTEELKSLKSQL